MHKNLSEKFRIRKEIQIIDKFKLIFKQDIKCDDYIIEVIFDCVKDLYIFFCKEIDFISKEDDQYNFYLLKSNNNGYPLLEFLLNRVCQNIEQVKANVVKTNQKAINNAKLKEERKSSEYQEVSNIRAGVEGLPSLLRRRYHIDTRPVKGKFYLKLEFSTSIIAINIKRASKIAQNTTIITPKLTSWIKFKISMIIPLTKLSVSRWFLVSNHTII